MVNWTLCWFEAPEVKSTLPSLSPFIESAIYLDLSLIDQGVSVSRLSQMHIHDSLVRLLHRTRLNPRLNILLCGKFEHFLRTSVLRIIFLIQKTCLDLIRSTNGTTTNLNPLHNQRERIESRHRLLGSADLHKCSLDT